MHPDGVKPEWIYYAKPIAPQTATESPMAFGSPEQFTTRNFGLNLQAMVDGPSKPGFSTGGGGSFALPDDKMNKRAFDAGRNREAEPTPDLAPEQPLDFFDFMRRKWGINPVVFFVCVGLLGFFCFVLVCFSVVLLILLARRR